ncbi:hypothetical protein COO60DRAFT_1462088 [Scenedesmus sp. NREL 46B-D3]|nr:hypothetical protein COO60DRAFT_1462088 [Scenedesmus sp. NREL 46B-D3]
MNEQLRFRYYCAVSSAQRETVLQCNATEAKLLFQFQLISFPASATWALLKQSMALRIQEATAGTLEVLLAYTDQADEGRFPRATLCSLTYLHHLLPGSIPVANCPTPAAALPANDGQHDCISAPELLEACKKHSTLVAPVPPAWRIPDGLLHSGLQALRCQQEGVAWMMARERNPGRVELDVGGTLRTIQATSSKFAGTICQLFSVLSTLRLPQLPPGGILADGMGLGKTVQAIMLTVAGPAQAPTKTAALAKKLKLWPGGSLILVPKVLLGQLQAWRFSARFARPLWVCAGSAGGAHAEHQDNNAAGAGAAGSAAAGTAERMKVVVAVSDKQVMGQVQRLCTELEIPATSLEGRDAANKLRTFSLRTSSSWVLILRLGRQTHEQSAGLTLTCCSRLLVVDTLPREDLLRQLLGRIHRYGQQQEQHVEFLMGRGSVHEAMYDRLVKPTLEKLHTNNHFINDNAQQFDEQEGGEQLDGAAQADGWHDATDRLHTDLKQQLLQDMAMQSAWY